MANTKLIIIIVIIAVIAAAVLLLLFGVKTDKPIDGPGLINGYGDKDEEQVMLVDCYNAVVATVGGDRYSETVLYQNRDGSCEVHYYSKSADSSTEAHTAYRVEQGVIEDAYKIINDNDIASWNEKYKGPGLDGAVHVLKFRGNDGEYIRVSTDCMPDDGIRIMGEVKSCLDSYVSEGNLIR